MLKNESCQQEFLDKTSSILDKCTKFSETRCRPSASCLEGKQDRMRLRGCWFLDLRFVNGHEIGEFSWDKEVE